jgi:hypothetical protein
MFMGTPAHFIAIYCTQILHVSHCMRRHKEAITAVTSCIHGSIWVRNTAGLQAGRFFGQDARRTHLTSTMAGWQAEGRVRLAN